MKFLLKGFQCGFTILLKNRVQKYPFYSNFSEFLFKNRFLKQIVILSGSEESTAARLNANF